MDRHDAMRQGRRRQVAAIHKESGVTVKSLGKCRGVRCRIGQGIFIQHRHERLPSLVEFALQTATLGDAAAVGLHIETFDKFHVWLSGPKHLAHADAVSRTAQFEAAPLAARRKNEALAG